MAWLKWSFQKTTCRPHWCLTCKKEIPRGFPCYVMSYQVKIKTVVAYKCQDCHKAQEALKCAF